MWNFLNLFTDIFLIKSSSFRCQHEAKILRRKFWRKWGLATMKKKKMVSKRDNITNNDYTQVVVDLSFHLSQNGWGQKLPKSWKMERYSGMTFQSSDPVLDLFRCFSEFLCIPFAATYIFTLKKLHSKLWKHFSRKLIFLKLNFRNSRLRESGKNIFVFVSFCREFYLVPPSVLISIFLISPKLSFFLNNVAYSNKVRTYQIW